jgi:thiosulfate reductase/polysulfide reductase chain A
MFLRRQAVLPRYDTLPAPIIVKRLADRLGFGRFFPYETMEDLVKWQLEGTGFTLEDFDRKGFVAYTDKEIWWDRENGLKLKTPSKKIEFVSSLLEKAGYPSFPPYESVMAPPEGRYRLMVGRCAQHTHVSTQNNPYLNELVPENVLWINRREAERLGISNGDFVEVSSSCGDVCLKAYVTDLIHPEAVFMLHGFGHKARFATRSFDKGAADAVLQENKSDIVGGSPALDDTLVRVRRAYKK